jgi:biopolymer transport protein ExbD
MAGTATPGESSDNPVPINVTAMVDIIFCLCIFFMCSFHFRQLEGKLESWLPKDKGVNTTPVTKVMLEEVRIFLKFDQRAADASMAVKRQVGHQAVRTDDELRDVLRGMVQNFARSGLSEVPVIIDSDPLVPWRDVVNVLSLCRQEKLQKLEFASPRA